MSSPEKVFKAGIMREPGWLYFVSNGNLMRTRMKRGYDYYYKKSKPELVLKTDVNTEKGYIYYLDKQGDISRSPTAWGKKKAQTYKEFGKATKQIVKNETSPEIEKEITQKTVGDKTSTGGSMELVEVKSKNGNYTSRIKGTQILHKEDGPASIMYNGTRKEWRQYGQLHRIGGPAVIDGNEHQYYFRGVLHRLDGPADEEVNTTYRYRTKQYYILGENKTPAQFKAITSNPKLMAAIRAYTGEGPAMEASDGKASAKEATLLPLAAVAAGIAGLGFAAGRIQRAQANKVKIAAPVEVRA